MVMTINLWIPEVGYLNEAMVVDIPLSSSRGGMSHGSEVRFQGLSRSEMTDAYFIFRIYRYEAFSQVSGEARMVVGSTKDMKRPYACGLLSLRHDDFHQRPVDAHSVSFEDPFPWYLQICPSPVT
jgi:hypothetical protein